MPATFTIPLITVIPGQTITASLWNDEFVNIYDNLIPSGIDDYSSNDTQMQTSSDPYPGGSTSRPTSLQGEFERIRYQIAAILGEAYWYIDPDVDLATFKTRFDAHTHDGTSNNGPQIQAAGLASNAVTTAKINDLAVTDAKINDVAGSKLTGTVTPSDNTVSAAKLQALAVTDAKVNDVAASKITGTLPVGHGGTGVTTSLIKVVAYSGNGSTQDIAHGLGAQPDIVIISIAGTGGNIPHLFIAGMTNSHDFNGTNQTNGVTAVNSTNVSLGSNSAVNQNSVAYLMIVIRTN